MRSIKIQRKADQAMIVTDGKVAESFVSRLRGLIGRKSFAPGEGLLFPRCNDVHMWMMSIPIDLVFLKPISLEGDQVSTWEIVKLYGSAKPWKILPVFCAHAKDTLELPAGTIQTHHLKTGEVLCTVL